MMLLSLHGAGDRMVAGIPTHPEPPPKSPPPPPPMPRLPDEDAPETPPSEPPPVPVEDPPSEPGPRGPFVV
jgi:hypothetical protein